MFPLALQEEFPAVLTQRSGMDKKAIQIIEALSDNAVGPYAIASLMKEVYALQ
jgi:hypothetical protein